MRGVDGCGAGWVCAELDLDTGRVSVQVFADAKALFSGSSSVVTAIDIPIGLPAAMSRSCDRRARRLLGPRSSSVFPVPMRAALNAGSYEESCLANQALCGKKLSKQTFAILPKIREVDEALRESIELRPAVWEVHPEVSFYFWNERNPMAYPKKSGFGFAERLALVEARFGDAACLARDAIPNRLAADDDLLDAFAALWTAGRINAGTSTRLPEAEERDETGLSMQILA